jgi:glycosyltransferase involved in cell wall biosynthesis
MTRISVAMPTRNAERTVSAAIRSIREQSWKDFDFVIVDHASTDGTPEILAKAAREDSRIKVIRAEGTFVEAANLAWRETKGSLIARMDSDDVAHPERLARQVEFLNSRPELAACGSLVRIGKRGAGGSIEAAEGGYQRYERWVNSVITPAQILRERFVDSPLPNPTALIRREVLEALGGYHDPGWAEDYDFWLRLLEKGFQLGKVEEILLDWFDVPDRSTRTVPRYELTRFQEAKAYYLSRIPEVEQLGVTLCGAGPIGKEMARYLRNRKIEVGAFCEVNKRQIGNRIDGIPVEGSDAIAGKRGSTILLSAVGQPGARNRIRELAVDAGYVEGENFFCVA